MRAIVVLGMAMLMSGCIVIDREVRFYTAADVDAITSQMECRQVARNLLEIARCDLAALARRWRLVWVVRIVRVWLVRIAHDASFLVVGTRVNAARGMTVPLCLGLAVGLGGGFRRSEVAEEDRLAANPDARFVVGVGDVPAQVLAALGLVVFDPGDANARKSFHTLAVFRRRRARPTMNAPAAMMPGMPAPATGPGTAFTAVTIA